MTRWVVQENTEIDDRAWGRLVDRQPTANMFHRHDLIAVLSGGGVKPQVFAAQDRETGELDGLIAGLRIGVFGRLAQRITSRVVVFGGLLCADPDCLPQLLAHYGRALAGRALFSELRNMADATAFDPALREAGWTYEPHVNYEIDLTQGPDELWKNLSAGARKNIRRTLDRGVEIREATTPEEFESFHALVQRTYRRARVPLLARSVLHQAWQELPAHRLAGFWLLLADGRPVAARAALYHVGLVFDWYAGSEMPAPRGLYPNETLAWHVIREASRLGFRRFDFGGAGHPDRPYGPREFKRKFNGRLVQFGRYRLVHSPLILPWAERTYGVLRRFL